jgi:hypothetical protein
VQQGSGQPRPAQQLAQHMGSPRALEAWRRRGQAWHLESVRRLHGMDCGATHASACFERKHATPACSGLAGSCLIVASASARKCNPVTQVAGRMHCLSDKNGQLLTSRLWTSSRVRVTMSNACPPERWWTSKMSRSQSKICDEHPCRQRAPLLRFMHLLRLLLCSDPGGAAHRELAGFCFWHVLSEAHLRFELLHQRPDLGVAEHRAAAMSGCIGFRSSARV